MRNDNSDMISTDLLKNPFLFFVFSCVIRSDLDDSMKTMLDTT